VPHDLLDLCTAILYAVSNLALSKSSQQIDYYNSRRRHSTLGNTAPIDYIIQEKILPQPAPCCLT